MKLTNGDCLLEFANIPSDSVDSCVCDPPYGLSKEPNIAEVMKHWIEDKTYQHKGSGFMGKSWDSFVPGPEYWKEVFRVLKPGGYLLAMSSSRTWDLLSIAIRFAGFQNRDTITVHGIPMLSWEYGQGFPKSLGVAKALRSIGVAGSESDKWEGWGTGLKPSCEIVLVFRKPIKESTVAKQVLKTGTGAINIDACRIDGLDGRWPANTIMIHMPDCGDACTPECSIAVMDKQSGILKSGDNAVRTKVGTFLEHGGLGKAGDIQKTYGDKGGGSRFFPNLEWEPGEIESAFLYAGKVSPKERNAGMKEEEKEVIEDDTLSSSLEKSPDQKNTHPTVKPIALMRWLCRLVTKPGGVILDPFMGSGTTGVAAFREGFDFIGIELDRVFFEIAQKRINHDAEEKK